MAYQRELLEWAAHINERGNLLKINLLAPPSYSPLSLGFQESVEVTCQKFKHPVSGEVRYLVGPATDFDTEIIQQHTEALPKIKAARAEAARRWANKQGNIQAEFEDIPDEFVVHYAEQFKMWCAELKQRGTKCAIVLDLAPGEKRPRDEADRPIMGGVWMQATADWSNPEKPRLIIKPASEHDQEEMNKHVSKMRRHWSQ